MYLILLYFVYFIIYSVIGWAVETFYMMVTTKKLSDRGFLIGPYCPIYGCGSIMMILYLTQYKDNVITVFILGLVICSILEYVTSYVMEKLFKTRWWDYSDAKFNLNGRICGQNCLLFGLGGIGVIYIIQPILSRLLNVIPSNGLIVIAIFILIIFLIDIIISLNVMANFKKTLTKLDLKKDSTKEFNKAVKEILSNNHKRLEQRLIKAFPDVSKLIEVKNEIKDEIIEFGTETKEKIKELEEDIKDFLKRD